MRQYGLGYVNLPPFADGLVIAGWVRWNGGAKESPKWARRVIGGKTGDPDHAGHPPNTQRSGHRVTAVQTRKGLHSF
jgi:hypothetical protein